MIVLKKKGEKGCKSGQEGCEQNGEDDPGFRLPRQPLKRSGVGHSLGVLPKGEDCQELGPHWAPLGTCICSVQVLFVRQSLKVAVTFCSYLVQLIKIVLQKIPIIVSFPKKDVSLKPEA